VVSGSVSGSVSGPAGSTRPVVRIDRDICIGAGLCVLAAPEVFDQADDGLVVMIVDDPGEDADDAVREAVRRCPSGALSLRE
jgi:ferredoxin